MKLLPIFAAVILAATAQAYGQGELDNLKDGLQTPAPTVAATPKPAAIQQTPAAARATTTTAPRPTPALRPSVKDELAHGHFITASDFSAMAGKKVPAGTFLTGQFQFSGEQSGGRKLFIDAGLFHAGKTRLYIRFPVAPDPRVLASGSSTKWEKAGPLRVEQIVAVKEGISVYCTDVTP